MTDITSMINSVIQILDNAVYPDDLHDRLHQLEQAERAIRNLIALTDEDIADDE